jgi:hypothetical protein
MSSQAMKALVIQFIVLRKTLHNVFPTYRRIQRMMLQTMKALDQFIVLRKTLHNVVVDLHLGLFRSRGRVFRVLFGASRIASFGFGRSGRLRFSHLWREFFAKKKIAQIQVI